MEIGEILKELEKWVEEDKENRAIFLIATRDLGDRFIADSGFVGKGENLVEAFFNRKDEACKSFREMVEQEDMIRTLRRLKRTIKSMQ